MVRNKHGMLEITKAYQNDKPQSVVDATQRRFRELKKKVSPSKNDNSWLGRSEIKDRPKKKTIIEKSHRLWEKWYRYGKDSARDNKKPPKNVILLHFREASRVKGALEDELDTSIASSAEGEAKSRLADLVEEVLKAKFPEQDISHMTQQEQDAFNEQIENARTIAKQYIKKVVERYTGESLENPTKSPEKSSKRSARVPDEWSEYFSKHLDQAKIVLEHGEFVKSLKQKVTTRKIEATKKLAEVERKLNTLRSQFMAMDHRDFSEAQGEGIIWEGRGRSNTIKGNENLIAMNLHELQLQAFQAGKINNEMLNISDKENSEQHKKLQEDFNTAKQSFKERVFNILTVHGYNLEGYEGPKVPKPQRPQHLSVDTHHY